MNPADPALLAAIQFLSKQVANLPLATIAANSNSSAVQRVYVANSNWAAPVPVVIEGGGGAGAGKEGSGGAGAGRTGGGGAGPIRALTAVGSALGTAFGALLGPLGTLTTFLTSATSGFQVFSSAIALFAQSVGPIIMPVLFTLSVGLVAAAETLQKKLMPAMDEFTKWVLSTGLPAMLQFAEAVGKAAQALMWLADSKLGRLVTGSDEGKRGGMFGAINRTVDRVSGETVAGPESDGSTVGRLKALHRGADDLMEVMFGRPGKTTADAKNWLMKKTYKMAYGTDAADPYSGPGVVTDGAGAQKEQDTNASGARAARKVLAEYQFQMNPKSRIGDVAGNWSAAQQSILSMSPFQRETLELQRKEITLLEQALANYEKTGIYTKPETGGAPEGGLAALGSMPIKGN